MSITEDYRNKHATKLANKVLHIRDLVRHEIKEYEKELYIFGEDYDERCAAAHVHNEIELGAKTEIDDSLNKLYEYVVRTLCVDTN